MEKIQEVHEKVKGVEGWLTKNEGALLYTLASETKGKGAVVEIGSWQGKSTIYIGTGLQQQKNKCKFYAVDPHTGSEEHKVEFGKVWTYDTFLKNVRSAKLDGVVTPICKDSITFGKEMNEPVEFIFIDGAHDFDSVEKDFNTWFPKIIDGGVMAFHDTYAGGDPYKVLKKLVYTSRNFGIVRSSDSITYVKKVKKNSLYTYTYNLVRMFLYDTKLRLRKLFK